MRNYITGLAVLVLVAGCGGWGDFKYKSDRFDYKMTFPDKWEVWDKSNDEVDFLEASLPDDSPDAKIIVRAIRVAPDISPNEIYPSFLDGSEFGDLSEFSIEDKGAISAKNSEGRYMKYTYLGEDKRMRGMKTMFIGNRMLLEISMEMANDDFILHEMDFNKMIHLVEL